MRTFGNIRLWPAMLITALAVALCACGPTHSTGSAAMSHAASAQANIPGADKAAAESLLAKCFPVSNTAEQVAFIKKAASDTKAHPNGSRKAFAACLGIPASQRPAFEAALLSDVEHGIATKAKRKDLVDNKLPALVLQYHGGQA